MKPIKSLRLISSVAASAALLATSGTSKASDDFVDGDVSIAFYQIIEGVVQADTYVFNMGPGSLYRENTANNVSLSTINPAIASSNIDADLDATFGTDWAESGTVYWSVVGMVQNFASTVNGDPSATCYLSAARNSLAPGALGKGSNFTNISLFNRGIFANNASAFLLTGTNNGITMTNANTSTSGVNLQGVILPISNNSSLEEFLPPATLTKFGIGNEPRQLLNAGPIAGGAAVEGALDIYRVINSTSGADLTAGASSGNAAVGVGQFIGTLTLDASGNLKVQAVGSATANFASWATTNGVTGGPNGDSDVDGIINLVEYALNLNPSGSDGSPGTYTGAGGSLSFTKRAEAVTNGDVTYAIQESDDLGITDAWTSVAAANTTSAISFAIPTGGGKKFYRLKVIAAP